MERIERRGGEAPVSLSSIEDDYGDVENGADEATPGAGADENDLLGLANEATVYEEEDPQVMDISLRGGVSLLPPLLGARTVC